MTISPARLAANRSNAQLSTGPKTPEGKAKSRQNAFQHGLAGAGDIVGPGEDLDLIQRRTVAFARELEAPGELGQTLAHRAALLSVRMEECSTRERVTVAAGAQAARDEFDANRLDALGGWIKTLEAGDGDPVPALSGLEAAPDGLPYLIGSWLMLRSSVNGHDHAAIERARRWLGQTDSPTPSHLVGRIDVEIARLRRQAEALGDAAATIAVDRHQAGVLAGFDPSPEATLARRYEAAAERGMYRAIRAIADLRRAQPAEVAAPLAGIIPTAPPAPPSNHPVNPPALPLPSPAPLGSFRAEVAVAASDWLTRASTPLEPPLFPPAPPKKRPDLRKLTKKRR